MKKHCFILALISAVFCASGVLYASGRNLNHNMSAEFCKTLNRSASTEVDAAFFNPAGTVFLTDGFHMYLGDQVIYQPVKIKISGGDANLLAGVSRGEYKGSKAAWYFPHGYMVLKKGRFAIAGGSNGLGGGGVAKFNNGLQQFDAGLNTTVGMGSIINRIYNGLGMASPIGGPVVSKLWASSAVYNVQLCFAYEVVKDILSISVGGRLLIGNTDVDINLHSLGGAYFGIIPGASDFHTYELGFAGGIIAGICIKPVTDLTVGITASWNSPLNLASKSFQDLIIGVQDPGLKNNGESAQQLPAQISIGIAYRVKGLQISPTFTYQFNQFAHWKGKEKGFTGGYDVGIGFDYTISGAPINIGAGYGYAFSGARPSIRDQVHEELSYHNVGFGLTWIINEKMSLTISEVFTQYIPENVNEGAESALRLIPARYYKRSFLTAVGLTTRI